MVNQQEHSWADPNPELMAFGRTGASLGVFAAGFPSDASRDRASRISRAAESHERSGLKVGSRGVNLNGCFVLEGAPQVKPIS